MTTVVLTIILVLAGQKPTSLNLPMSDLATCQEEANRFLTFEQPADKPKILMRAAGCRIDTPEAPGIDVNK